MATEIKNGKEVSDKNLMDTNTVMPSSKKSQKKKGNKIKKNPFKRTKNFPPVSLEKCLTIAHKIRKLNGGNPWSPSSVGKAIGVSNTAKLFQYLASSRDFGFTTGSTNTTEIALTEFGREVVFADTLEIQRKKKIEAFLRIKLFKEVLEYYKGVNLPEMEFLSNVLESKFHLEPSLHDEFAKIFEENCRDLGITSDKPLEEADFDEASPTTVILGEAKKGTKTKLSAFVIMPFTEKENNRPIKFFSEVLKSLLTPSGVEAGFTVETANRQGSDVIHSTIINDLLDADIVIADLTDHNPNVLFELGVRMAIDKKPVALIKSKDTGKIFDVDNMLRVFEYDQNLWKSTLEEDIPALTKHIKAAWDNRDSDQTYMKILRKGSNDNK